MLPIRNISYLLPMCCSFWEKCKNSPKTDLGCRTPLFKNRKYKDKIVSAQISKLPQSPANRLLNIRRKINSGSLLSRLIILISPVLATLFVGTCPFSSACVSSSEEYQRPCFCTPETTYLQWCDKDSCLYPLQQALQGMRLCSWYHLIPYWCYKILQDIDCNTTNLIYLITCSCCGIQYVGENTSYWDLYCVTHWL